ncbi:amidase family protein [Sutcliffiella rhizosphaerae]|uniref:Amidase AmiD n=1 Tax=Sutcliffiella rhizosphaerae TaxID=2880967 RepID=A0ABM8YUQ9_9BACI|nr:amidase family protein [Sutcliffiella rhizosphaerae]CAG9623713.1 Putative amidase AmiD [Sutcliffiella rhizosphaerae]
MFQPKLASLVDDWLPSASIDTLQEAMEKGEISSKDLVLMYLHRISQYDKKGPKINSVLEVNPDAVFIAEALDLERKRSGKRGPLHGIPILLKDNIDTGDMMHTSAGSLALENHVAKEDSTVASQLREAGAVILGKTNMTEWANFMTENMPNGFSSRGGQVLNPYGPGTFDVGGSSSGSGAAIASGLAAAAIGTETSGSILSPASSNSIVGIKPTVGLISRKGIIPISFSQDTAGPMTKTVQDAAILLSALTKQDKKDIATYINPEPGIDYTAFLLKDGLKGKRIGVAKDPSFTYLSDEEALMMEEAIASLRDNGAIVIDSVEIPFAKEKWDYNTLLYEFKPSLNAYLHQTGPTVPIKNLKELIAFNKRDFEVMLQHKQTVLEESESLSGKLVEEEYIQSREKDIYRTREAGIDALMAEYNLDAILTPNNYGAGIPAKAGYPSITVPAGYTNEGKPVGATFTARAFEESTLIQIAYGYEQATNHRKAPILKEKEVKA